jgi:uncharacterized protein YjbI with pentapeptide repeats
MSTAPRLPLDPDLPEQLASAVDLSVLVDAEFDGLMIEGVDWSGQSAQGLQLSESKLSGVDLGGAFLTRGRLRDVVVMEGDWANVMADEAVLRRVRFEGVRLTGANFSASTMENVTFSGCRLDLASFRFANIDSVLFHRCRMEGSDLYDAQITSATFVDCDLTEVGLTGATFDRSEMRGCDLSGARNPEQLRGIRMPWVDIIRAAGELAAAVGIERLE